MLKRAASWTLVVSVAFAAVAICASYQASTSTDPRLSNYVPGDHVVEDVGVDFAASPVTFVLVVRSSCSVCKANLEAYKKIVTERNARASVVLVGLAEDDGLAADGSELGARVFYAKALSNKLQIVPTTLEVDRLGVVISSKRGKLTGSDVEQYIADSVRMASEQ